MHELEALLEVYTLEEILENLGLEDLDVLLILEDQGFLEKLTLTLPVTI